MKLFIEYLDEENSLSISNELLGNKAVDEMYVNALMHGRQQLLKLVR